MLKGQNMTLILLTKNFEPLFFSIKWVLYQQSCLNFLNCVLRVHFKLCKCKFFTSYTQNMPTLIKYAFGSFMSQFQ